MFEETIKFYQQKYHLPITFATQEWQLDEWDREGMLIGIPAYAEKNKQIQGMRVKWDHLFGLKLNGRAIMVNKVIVAYVGENFLVLTFIPVCDKAKAYTRTMLDEAIPKLARYVRMQQLKNFTSQMAVVSNNIKTQKQASIDKDQWEINDLSRKMMELHERMASDRMMLQFYDKSEDQLKNKVIRMYLELQKLVPGCYQSFQFKDNSIIGITNDIHIEWEYHDYHFNPYTVTFHLETGHIKITGQDNYANEGTYIHPHVSDQDVCWGNVGTSIARLAGSMELYGLFQLIHEFLCTYNEADPFQRIEHWDPNWEDEDDDLPYCEYCDSTGHDISDCEYCWYCEDCHLHHDVDDEECPNREVPNEQAA